MLTDVQEGLDLALLDSLGREADRLQHLGRTAAVLSEDPEVEKAAAQAAQKARDDQQFFAATASQIKELSRNMAAHLAASPGHEDGARPAEAQALSQQLDKAAEDLIKAQADAQARLEEEVRTVRAILAEHDYIKKLLEGGGQATDKQFDVIAFPRTANTKSRILQVAGGAGTGKTLCLLAKLIRDVCPPRQLGLLPEEPKEGLFVCFNTALKMHVQALLRHIPEAGGRISVVSFDQFINQLVRADPAEEFAHLASYASASRYQSGTGSFWKLIYEQDARAAVADAMRAVAGRHPAHARDFYLEASDAANVAWMFDELAWIEARYQDEAEARERYLDARRIGRGKAHNNQLNPEARLIIIEVWDVFQRLLEERRQYTIEQAVKRLLKDPNLPRYHAIAVDEVQDLTVSSVKLLARMRANDQSYVYICGDENQKIYQRDFTWKELDENLHGYTITLDANKRNSRAIEAFASRLLGAHTAKEDASDLVFVGDWSEDSIMGLVANIRRSFPSQTVALISGDVRTWYGPARDRRISVCNARESGVADPGFYLIGEMAAKGLEFDNVIVDCAHFRETDEQTLKNILYVNCTRARHRLYLRYSGEPPALLRQHYPDFL